MNNKPTFDKIFAGHYDCFEREVKYLHKKKIARERQPSTKKQHFSCPWLSDK
jgi:hypothetical protein